MNHCQDQKRAIAWADSLHGGLGPYVNTGSAIGTYKVGCKIPCIQIGATDNRDLYKTSFDSKYNFCAHSDPDDAVEKFALGWVMMVPVTKLATAGKVLGGGLVVKGSAFAATSGATVLNIDKMVKSKWPGDATGVEGSNLQNIFDIMAGFLSAGWDLGKWALGALKWTVSGTVIMDVESTITNTWDSCSNNEPVFTINYYKDSEFKQPMGDNPVLKAGTYYILIESSIPLATPPEICIDSEGSINEVGFSGGACTYAQTNIVKNKDGVEDISKRIYSYARTVSADSATTGKDKDKIKIQTDSNSNIIPVNWDVGSAFIKT